MEQQNQMRTLSDQESLAMLKDLTFISIISADNDELPEDTKQEILSRYDKHVKDKAWHYILYPMIKAGVPKEKVDRYIQLFERE